MGAFNIPLSIQQPQMTPTPVSPLVAQQQKLGLQQLANAVAIQKQVQQENNLKIQAANEDRDDDQKFQQIFKDNNGDWDKTLESATGSMRARNLARYQTDHQKIVQTAHELASSKNLEQTTQFAKIKTQNELIGQTIDGVMRAPDELKDQVYQDSIASLAKQGVDVSQFPPTRPADDVLQAKAAQVGYIGKILHNADLKALEDSRKAQAERAAAAARRTDAEEAAKDTQRAVAEAAATHMGVTNQQQHDEWLADVNSKHPDLANRYKNLTTFSPGTQQRIQDMALTPEERVKKIQKEREDASAAERAAVSGGITGLIYRANDPTLPAGQRDAARKGVEEYKRVHSDISASGSAAADARFDRRELDRANKQAADDAARHTSQQVAEAKEWAMSKRIHALMDQARADEQTTITDPRNGRKMTLQEAQGEADAAGTRATTHQESARQLRSKHGWGEFSDEGGGVAEDAPVQDVPKTTSMAKVKEFATSKFKGDIAAAKAAIKAQGYSITDER